MPATEINREALEKVLIQFGDAQGIPWCFFKTSKFSQKERVELFKGGIDITTQTIKLEDLEEMKSYSVACSVDI